jgi:outer membrane protein assembly factor BamB
MRYLYFSSLVIIVVLGCCKEPQQPNISNSLETIWKAPLSTGGTETATMDPIIYKNLVIYCADDGNINKSKLVALNRNDGKLVWEWRFTDFELGNFTSSQAYVYNNIMVIPILGSDYRVVAINLDNGTKLWQTNLLEAGTWQITGYQNKVFHVRGAFDKSKDEIAMADVSTGNWQVIYPISKNNVPALIFDLQKYKDNQGKEFLAFLTGTWESFSYQRSEYKIIKYSLDSNKVVYEKKLDFFLSNGGTYRLANYSDGKFWLNVIATHFYGVDEQTGDKALEVLIPISNRTGKMLAAGGKVFITTEEIVYGFDANTGSRLWREENTSGGSPSRLLYNNSVLYFVGSGKFNAIDANTGRV